MKDKIINMLNRGLTPGQIAEDLDCSETLIFMIIKEVRAEE
jgi:orotate phosphoribosyltransferase-like protein